MTTVAFDGKTMAADSLAVDAWGMKETAVRKIKCGLDFICGMSGDSGLLLRWWDSVEHDNALHVLNAGYAPYDKDNNDPAILIACAKGVFRHASGSFIKCSRPFHAIGSGRDYALAAMHLGKSAKVAVEIAMEFDNGTGGDILAIKLSSVCQS